MWAHDSSPTWHSARHSDRLNGCMPRANCRLTNKVRSCSPRSEPVVCAQHRRELMGCKSPVGEPNWTHESNTTTSRRQGLTREGWSGGSPSANVRDDEQKPHRRPGGSRRDKHKTAKPIGLTLKVNGAFSHGEFASLPGEICATSGVFG